MVHPPGHDFQCKLTCFYGHPESARRYESWALLDHLNSFYPKAWMCIVDFNEIVEQGEKYGGALRRDSQMAQFRVPLENCGLSDLGYKGSKFTWTNCHQDETFMKERLDRAVVNKAWCEMNSNYEVQVLAAKSSDHKPLLLRFFDANAGLPNYYKSFKFEASWLADGECMDVVNEAWGMDVSGGMGIQTARLKLAQCQTQLTRWSSRKFGDAQKVLKMKTKLLNELQ